MKVGLFGTKILRDVTKVEFDCPSYDETRVIMHMRTGLVEEELAFHLDGIVDDDVPDDWLLLGDRR